MPEATCMLGQEGTTAVAPIEVTLRPVEGAFPSTKGDVLLISNANPQRSGTMPVTVWDTNAIVAWLPETISGTPAPNETFRVEANSGDTTYEANPVRVTGLPGSGYPPTHMPATCMPGQEGTAAVAPTTVVLRPVEGTFPNTEGDVLLISNANAQRSGTMPVKEWDPNEIVAWLPEAIPGTPAPDETFRVEANSGETTYEASPVRVTGLPGSG